MVILPGPLRGRLLAASGLVLAGLVGLTMDLPVARWFVDPPLAGDVRKLITFSEIFAHGLGVILITLTAAVLDPRNGRVVWFLLVHSLGAGLLANLLKMLLGRCRPAYCDLRDTNIFHTFLDWFPAATSSQYTSWFDPRYASFPSAHAATAAGLAVGLSILYPKGRWLFVVFAILAGIQRCHSHAHFVSDVLWGYAVGLAWTCVAWRLWPHGLAPTVIAPPRTEWRKD